MRPSLLVLLGAALLAGCVQPAPAATGVDASSADAPATPPQLLAWKGHIFTPAFTVLSHGQPEETVSYPIQQEGFMFHVMEAPRAMEIRLDWTGSPDAVFTINPHFMKSHQNGSIDVPPFVDDGSTTFLNYHTKASSLNPQCLRIPAADLQAGMWEAMVHAVPQQAKPGAGAVLPVDFTLTIGLDGGMGEILADERHGHKDKAVFEEHTSEPCTMLMPAAN
jgi:hypothetical protein